MAYITMPFVTQIHLYVPPPARVSRMAMVRWSKTIPNDTLIELSTLNLLGKPRATKVAISELSPAKERFGVANYVRPTKELNMKRPIWAGRAIGQFGVHSGQKDRSGLNLWDTIAASIALQKK